MRDEELLDRTQLPAAVRQIVSAVLADSLGIEMRPDDGEPLLSSGLIDSLSLLKLLEALSLRLGVAVDPMEVTLDNFDTVSRIQAFARSKLADRGPTGER